MSDMLIHVLGFPQVVANDDFSQVQFSFFLSPHGPIRFLLCVSLMVHFIF